MVDSSFLTNTSCLHVSDLDKSVKWYADAFGVSVIKSVSTDKYKSAFIALDSEGHVNAGLPLAQRDGVVELRQLIGVSSAVKIYNGNADPYKGFGHLCFAVSNIEEAQKKLLGLGVEFKKRVEDGLMKTIAFVLDPDQYWIELIENAINKKDGIYDLSSNRMNHTMVRVKDPIRSLKFYKEVLGMKLYSVLEVTPAEFTLYFLGYEHDKGYIEGKETAISKAARQSIIELTHNWGTENDDSFEGYYIFGQDEKVIGFDHFSISCKDSASFIKKLEEKDVKFVEKSSNETATIADPDGWKIEIHNYNYFN
jgi:lactoylglutathione lyase